MISAIVAILLAVTPTPTPAPTISSSPPEPSCSDSALIRACDGSGQIVVDASDGSGSTAAPGSLGGSTNTAAGCPTPDAPSTSPNSPIADLPRDTCFGLSGAQARQPTAADVRARAVRMIPSAAIGMAPHDTTLVNIQTIMWVNAPKSRTLPAVQILGQQVTIMIALDHVDWTFGDEKTATENGAGAPYDETDHPCSTRLCPGYFGHIYPNRGPVTVRATANWHASFRVGGGPVVQIPGTIAGPTATSDLAVKEARGVLIPNPGGR